jgi:N-acyl-phosphatidylethanolamine-hydrolysing phospholipase D
MFVSLAFAVAIGVAGAVESSNPSLGPAPRDADGRFTNPVGPLGHGSIGVRLPFGFRRVYHTFLGRDGSASHAVNDGTFVRENARHSVPTVTWIGHATLLFQLDHISVLSDPIWSQRASPVEFGGPPRLVAPGIAVEDRPPIDAVVISHNHYDHLDLPSLITLAEQNATTRFLVPLGNADLLRSNGIENVTELDWGETATVGSVTIHCLPAQHWSQRGIGDRNRALWSSWALIGAEQRFYFAGDTGYFDGFATIGAKLGPFDVAAIPIGAYLPEAMMKMAHVNPEQAFQAGVDVRARRLLGIHWGTFDLSDEPLDEPPLRFRRAAEQAGRGEDVWIFEVGETRVLPGFEVKLP